MLVTKKWADLASVIPVQQLFVETDAPFVQKKYIGHEIPLIEETIDLLSKSYGGDRVSIGDALNQNLSKLFTSSV